MDSCCENKSEELKGLASRQSKTLWIVLIINFSMFFVEGVAGLAAKSVSLLADSLDMLGDAFVYAFSLFVIGKSTIWSSGVSLLKGIIMTSLGIGVLVNGVQRFLLPQLPVAQTMGLIGALALVANLICAILLLKHREDDLNMRSTWLCSRNDVIANLGVLFASGAVYLTKTKYPDLIVGIIIGFIILKSSSHIVMESIKSFKNLND